MKNKYNFKRSDIERLITILDNSINIIRDDIVDLGHVDPANDTGNAGRTQQLEYNSYINTLNNYDTQIAVLEEVRRGLVEFLNQIDENVGLKEEKFIFEEDIVNPLLKDLTKLIENRKTYNSIVKEDNWFDVWEATAVCMPQTPTPSEMEVYNKRKLAYNYDRKILDDLNDSLHRGIITVESLMGEINDDYQLYFFPLEGEELIDTIIKSLNLTIDLNIQDFKESLGPYKAEILKPDLTKAFKISKDTFTIIKGKMADNQWAIVSDYFDIEIVEDICEVTVKYEAFEELLKVNPNALDEVWGYFDEVGIEGIHPLSEVEKLPNGWEKTGRYFQIGGYVIDAYTFIDGVRNNDWGEVGSVIGGLAGGALGSFIIDAIIVGTPAKWLVAVGAVGGGLIGSVGGEKIGDTLQKSIEETSDEVAKYLDEGDTLFEAKVKAKLNKNRA